jgi:hypothetical protein
MVPAPTPNATSRSPKMQAARSTDKQHDKQNGFECMGRLARVHGEHACHQERIGGGQDGGLHGDAAEQVAQHERCIACQGCRGGG